MGERILVAAAWAFVSRLGADGSTLVVKLVLAMLLVPEDFGLIGMAVVFTGILTAYSDHGLAAALVQRKEDELSESDLVTGFWTSLGAAGITFSLVVVAIGPFAAWFYGQPLLHPLLVVMAVPLLLDALRLIPRVRLTRALDFRALAIVQTVATSIAGVIAIGLAIAGLGVWSIALQGTIASLVSIPLYNRYARWKPRLHFSLTSFKKQAGYGIYVALNHTFAAGTKNLDYLLIGKLLGPHLLGVYTLAFVLVKTLRSKLVSILGQVMFPVYSQVQNEPERVKHYYLNSIRYNAVVVFPVLTALACMAEPMIQTVFGEQWLDAIVPLQILALSSMLYCLGGTSGVVLKALGKPDLHFKIAFWKDLLVTGPAIALGIYFWGLPGAAWGVVVHLGVARMLYQHYMRKLIGVTELDILTAVAPAIAGSAIMGSVGFLALGRGLIVTPLEMGIAAIVLIVLYMGSAAICGLGPDIRAVAGVVRSKLAGSAHA
jgi:teichuronic acid exporter